MNIGLVVSSCLMIVFHFPVRTSSDGLWLFNPAFTVYARFTSKVETEQSHTVDERRQTLGNFAHLHHLFLVDPGVIGCLQVEHGSVRPDLVFSITLAGFHRGSHHLLMLLF